MNLTLHRSRPNNVLTEGVDYLLTAEGLIQGVEIAPMIGVSCFNWSESEGHLRHGVAGLAKTIDDPCTLLIRYPDTVTPVQDYFIQLRYRHKKRNQRDIEHYSLCPTSHNLHTKDEWEHIIYGNDQSSCEWVPCDMIANAEHEEFDDIDHGCDDDDIQFLTTQANFALRAMFHVSFHIFPFLTYTHDKLIVNGLLTIMSNEKPESLTELMTEKLHPQMLRTVHSIVTNYASKLSSSSLSTCAGTVIGEMEDYLVGPQSDDEERGDDVGAESTVTTGNYLF
jgi:hypothetical protein